MIRANAILDHLTAVTEIQREDCIIAATEDFKVLRVYETVDQIELDRSYQVTVYITDCHEVRAVFPVQLAINNWLKKNGHMGEEIKVTPFEQDADQLMTISLEMDLIEKLNVTPIFNGEGVDHFEKFTLEGVDYKVEERVALKGI